MSTHCQRLQRRFVALLGILLASCTADDKPPESWQEVAFAARQAVRAQRFDEADTHFASVLRIATDDGSASGRLVAIEGLAAAHALRGNLAVADSLYGVLLDLQRRRVEVDSLSAMALVRTLRSRGEISLSRGLPEPARQCFAEILSLDADGAVDLRPEGGDLAYAIEGLSQALAARGTAGADSLQARATGLKFYAQGFSYYIGDDFVRAEQIFRAALRHQERVLGESQDLARTAHALGRVYEMLGRTDAAVSHYERAARVFDRIHIAPFDNAAVLDDLAAALPAGMARRDSLRRRAAALRGVESKQ